MIHYQASLTKIEACYNTQLPKIFRTLWLDGMLDWYKGWNKPWTSERNWYTEIYPTLKDKPPTLLHTGGYDFEMLTFQSILDFQNDPFQPNLEYSFIPFAQTGAGDHYGFYFTPNSTDIPIVLITHDDECLQFLSKNFEDFIVRMMLTRAADILEDEIEDDFSGNFEDFRTGILADLKTITPYLIPQYTKILETVFNKPVIKECEILSLHDYKSLLKTHLMFDLFDQEFSLS